MLRELIIHNMALIDDVRINFHEGLNVLTGETGAGKSIIIDAISLLMGERADRDAIRSGCQTSSIEGLFDISDDEQLMDRLRYLNINVTSDEYLVISREINIFGKNICRINGVGVSLSLLREVSSYLINLHGQWAHYSLLNAEQHLLLLDRFAGPAVEGLKEQIKMYYKEWQNSKKELAQWESDPQNRQREMDLITYQINEIDAAGLTVGEEEELENRRYIYSNYQKIMDILSRGYTALYQGKEGYPALLDILGELKKNLDGIAYVDEKLKEINNGINDILYMIEAIVFSIKSYIDSVEYDSRELTRIEARLDIINNLKRKYGNTIEDILRYRNKLQQRMNFYEHSQQYIDQLQTNISNIEKKLFELCTELSDKRKKAANMLERQIMQELKDVSMENAIFEVLINSPHSIEKAIYTEEGFDEVKFLMSANPGEPLKPLVKVASGGEMSRIMLALTVVLGRMDRVHTMIFDEIDSGISGKTAQKVAEKLACISIDHQVICVTHSAQIASMADIHYIVRKIVDKGHTHVEIQLLDFKERVKEIARLLGDTEFSAAGMNYADEVINTSQKFKKNYIRS